MKKKRLLTDRSDDLEDRLMAEKAKEVADEIDAEILRGMLSDLGWHQVVLTPMSWEDAYTVDQWVETNIKGRMWNRGLVWMFEKDQDSMWFKLRWMS